MKIFDFNDYKQFLNRHISALPSKGRGENTRIAKALGIHTTMVTHILKGAAHFSLEQTLSLANYLGFNYLETEYLVALVQWERAGTKAARDFCDRKVKDIKDKALNLNRRLGVENKLSEEARGTYYSSWVYSAVRLLSAIEKYQNVEAMSEELKLPIRKIRSVVDFLVRNGLCVEDGNKIIYGPVTTYLESTSPHVTKHHRNWRLKTQEKFDQISDKDLVFTFPVVISEKDALVIREKIVQLIEEIKKITDPSPSEEMYSLNMDWIKITGAD